jgi:hypothetical protein
MRLIILILSIFISVPALAAQYNNADCQQSKGSTNWLKSDGKSEKQTDTMAANKYTFNWKSQRITSSPGNECKIYKSNDSIISCVEVAEYGANLYTFYPKLGTMVYSSHKSWDNPMTSHMAEKASFNQFSAKCKFE